MIFKSWEEDFTERWVGLGFIAIKEGEQRLLGGTMQAELW